MVEKQVALDLIQELEGNPSIAKVQMEADPLGSYGGWLKRLVHEHPAFQGVPKETLEKLEVTPKPGSLLEIDVAGSCGGRKVEWFLVFTLA